MNVSPGRNVGVYSKTREVAIPVFVSLIGTLISLFPGNPNNMPLPSRDSGVFLYIGWRLISGDIPYKDVWDHKPPLIYFVDALGLSLTPDSQWGVWLLQFIFIFLTFFLIYRLLDREFQTYHYRCVDRLCPDITRSSNLPSEISSNRFALPVRRMVNSIRDISYIP